MNERRRRKAALTLEEASLEYELDQQDMRMDLRRWRANGKSPDFFVVDEQPRSWPVHDEQLPDYAATVRQLEQTVQSLAKQNMSLQEQVENLSDNDQAARRIDTLRWNNQELRTENAALRREIERLRGNGKR